jgi:hypothetical protein
MYEKLDRYNLVFDRRHNQCSCVLWSIAVNTFLQIRVHLLLLWYGLSSVTLYRNICFLMANLHDNSYQNKVPVDDSAILGYDAVSMCDYSWCLMEPNIEFFWDVFVLHDDGHTAVRKARKHPFNDTMLYLRKQRPQKKCCETVVSRGIHVIPCHVMTCHQCK